MKKQWISVEDALPKESMEVIVHTKIKGKECVSHAYFTDVRKLFIATDTLPRYWMKFGAGEITAYNEDAVTHWMPLPSFNQSDVENIDPYVHDLEQEIELLEDIIEKKQQNPKFKIKPLEWIEEDTFVAFGSFGTFEVMESGDDQDSWTGSLNDANGYDGYEEMDFPTVEQAKAYCHELHEKQIRAALKFVEVDA
ncbi:MAG TPA: DUF551 domain-containing protein [Sphaerochaeta sp.]|nr:DUF551 domain-containing protein [Sphaerochaeta sp.]